MASILAAQKVLERMTAPTGRAAPYPIGATPTETFDFARKYMYLNGEGIEILHQPAAHSDGDSMVFFRRSDVVVAGDVLDTTRFPVIDVARGGSVNGLIAALNRLVDLAIPSVPIVSREAGTLVIAGHGRICDQTDVAEYRDMVTIVRDRVRDARKAGMTLAQVKASVPTRGYTQTLRVGFGLVDDRQLRRGRVSEPLAGEAVNRRHVFPRYLISVALLAVSVGARVGAQNAGAQPPRSGAEGLGPDRSHRLLGVGRERGLALPHGDAGQRRLQGRPDHA